MPNIRWWEEGQSGSAEQVAVNVVLLLQWPKRARTCRHFGISRQTFYRWERRSDRHDLTTLEERSHRPRQVRQPTWTGELAERVLALRKKYPRWGKDKLVVLLHREKRHLSTSMVGRILADLKRRGALHEPPRPAVLLRAHRKANVLGPFASLNTGELSSRGISWRSTPRKSVCAAG